MKDWSPSDGDIILCRDSVGRRCSARDDRLTNAAIRCLKQPKGLLFEGCPIGRSQIQDDCWRATCGGSS